MKLFSEEELRQEVNEFIGAFQDLFGIRDEKRVLRDGESHTNTSEHGSLGDDLEAVFHKMRQVSRSYLQGHHPTEDTVALQAYELQATRGDCSAGALGENGGMFKTNLEVELTVEVERNSQLWDRWCSLQRVKKTDAMRWFISKYNSMVAEAAKDEESRKPNENAM